MQSTSAPKKTSLVEILRGEILRGRFAPGQRLPSHGELMKRFGVSGVTVQQTMNALSRQGFVRTLRRGGSFVTDRPPHLCHYAVVFPADGPGAVSRSRFLSTMHQQVLACRSPSLQLDLFYYDALCHHAGHLAEQGDHERLLEQVKSRTLAGIIFTFASAALAHTPIVNEPGIPRALMGAMATAESTTADHPGIPLVAMGDPAFRHVPVVQLDGPGFWGKAIDYLHRKGRRRLAIMGVSGQAPYLESILQYATSRARQRGMVVRDYWTHGFVAANLRTTANTAWMMMRLPSEDRPDAMIIADDNIVEPVTRGLLAAGMQDPQELDVVAHCNLPCPPAAAVPVRFLGYDSRQMLRSCVELIDLQRGRMLEKPKGDKAARALTILPAVFADEVPDAADQRWTQSGRGRS